MGPERWQQIERIYHAVAARPLEERAPLLDWECAGDADLRAEVDRMLAVESRGIGFLEAPAMEVAARALAQATPLRPGSRFGPYEIVAMLGAGGMGSVYKARDTRLNRTVAIKVLPAFGADDAERRRRFLQEARAASSLNHPNIITLHDILSEGRREALVMEYVEGHTLDERIAGKRLHLREALHYAVQIAGALAAAHAAGIVHRDVKPGNIMMTGEEPGMSTVKVLDFGLAKFTGAEAERTQTMATGEGRIVGTVAYMSPEQAEGRKIDARSDIFSFGVVLYEMLAGRKAFLRDTTTSTLAAILRDDFEPVLGIPESLRTLLSRCLRKDPDKRAQNMADIKVLLEETREEIEFPPAESRTAPRRWKTWTTAVALASGLAAASWLVLGRSGSKEAVLMVRPITSYPGLAAAPAFSPDGNQVAFSWNGEGQDNYDIYVKFVDSAAPLRLTANRAVDSLPAWSPDGRQIAFLRASGLTSQELLLVSPLGGAERKLADLSQGVNPAQWWTAPAWTPDGKFLAVRDETAIVLVSAESGEKRKLTSPPDGWAGDWQAAFSPDGRTLAFARIRNGPTQDIFLAPVSDGAKARQLTHDSIGIGGLAWTPDGNEVVFASSRAGDQTLWRISASGGTPERLPAVGAFASQPAIARHGQRAAFVRSTIRKSFWRLDLSPQGLRRPPVRLVMSSRNDGGPMLSPDGRHIAFTSNRSGSSEVWVCDSQGANAVQLTSLGFARNPYWSPDSRNIVFEARPGGRNLLFVIAATGGARRQVTSDEGYYPSWSRDGRWIYFYARTSGAIETWKIPLEGGTGVQLTKGGGGPGIESMDGKYFYYHKSQEIWRVPVGGGEETLVTSEQTNFMNMWALGGQGIYFTDPRAAEHQMIVKLFRFESGQSRQIAALDQPFPGSGTRLSLPADGRWLLYDQFDRNESDIMLIENFH
jgi:Tol biopolymer transport system component/serine/threonine protein kinase